VALLDLLDDGLAIEGQGERLPHADVPAAVMPASAMRFRRLISLERGLRDVKWHEGRHQRRRVKPRGRKRSGWCADRSALRRQRAKIAVVRSRSRSRTKILVSLVVLLMLAVIVPVAYVGWRQWVPGVRVVTPPPRLIGHKGAMTLDVQAARGNIARIEVRILQGDKSAVLAKQETPLGPRVNVPIAFETGALGLREGAATLEVWARDDFWRPLKRQDRAVASFPITIDLTPPKVEIVAATQYLSPGGAGIIVYRVSGAAREGVMLGTTRFAGTPTGPPEQNMRVVLVALPYDWTRTSPLSVTAQDEAGNVTTRGVPVEIKPRRFPRDRIEIKDSFLQMKVPELLPQWPPGKPLVEGFLVINRDQRKQAEDEKRRIGAKSADKPLFDGAFVQPRNTKVFSNFAETRTYFYQGREIDTQVHYGYDLASTKQSPIPAANKGVVAFAGPLTIYGNAVIIDHGLGLMTLYGHLSTIDVKVGEAVDKGKELGRSGNTGLAIGDHLHYEVLVHGISVTPLEWWDAKWIRDHISKPLKAAGLPEITGAEFASAAADGDDSKRAAAARPRPRRGR
jgi:murein DD-endopeptidase MepM/ murein hydrolase activator NlpD